MDIEQRLTRLRGLLGGSEAGISYFSAPGRVNLIGEHTDYNNCPVFPLAVDREILAACRFRDDQQVVVRDANSSYGTMEFVLERTITPYPTGSWGNYIKAWVQGIITNWPTLGSRMDSLHGFEMVMDSSIPPSAGMSSSSALVVLVSLVFLAVNGIQIDSQEERLALAEVCAASERYVGTQGGGMDQAAILLGVAGHALKIDFNPLQAQKAPLPSDFALVVAHSTVSAPKTQSVMDAYNRRSIECKLAAALIGQMAKSRHGIKGIKYIGDLTPAKTGLSFQDIEALVAEAVHPEPYTLADIGTALDLSPREVEAKWCKRRDGSMFPEPSDGFMVCKRLMHVRSEWQRVEQCYVALQKGDLREVGRLMDASHASCRDLHEVSCPELDTLTSLSRAAGAWGSRLTGAGFGGCTINLVPRSILSTYIETISMTYYRDKMGLPSGDSYVFVVTPTDGARIRLMPQRLF